MKYVVTNNGFTHEYDTLNHDYTIYGDDVMVSATITSFISECIDVCIPKSCALTDGMIEEIIKMIPTIFKQLYNVTIVFRKTADFAIYIFLSFDILENGVSLLLLAGLDDILHS
jgi:hypothetical protein